MDDMHVFERQVARRIHRMVGPVRPVDDLAVFDAVVAAHGPHTRGFTMFSAVKLIAAGAIVASFGGFLLSGVLTMPQEAPVPAAATTSPTVYAAPLPVSGTMNADAEGIAWGPPDEITQEFDRKTNRGGGNTWTFEVDDPRLSGVAYVLRDTDLIGPKYEYHEGEVFSGTLELVNADGSWVGSLRGYATMAPAMRHWHMELTGTGGHDGFSALLEAVGPYGSADVEGLVFPGAPPEYPDPVEVPSE